MLLLASNIALLIEPGTNMTISKRRGGWKSSSVAEGYLEENISSNNDCKKENSKPISSADLIRVGLAEFFGTALLLFLSCTGCTMGVQGDISSLHVSMAAGLALVVIIQMFGHISGAHVNPVVTMAAFILDEVTTKQVPVYVICQILGCLAGSGFHKILTPSESYIVGNSTEPGVCLNVPRGNVTEWQALGVEIILTTALVIAVCATWDQVNSNKMDSIPLRIGLIIVSLNVSAGAYTGASMNPARSLGPAVWTNNYTSHWVYWVGPTIGSLIASYFYKYIFLTGR